MIRAVSPSPQSQTQSPSGALTPILESVGATANVTTGQTIRLTARNVDEGSLVDFRVNGAVIDTLSQEPYETLFTVPDGQTMLPFDIAVRDPNGNSRVSQVTQMAIKPDLGTKIQGAVVQNATDGEAQPKSFTRGWGIERQNSFASISQLVRLRRLMHSNHCVPITQRQSTNQIQERCSGMILLVLT